MPFAQKLRILVAPLDWGLGHTTRCIPVIKALRKTGAEVIIAGNKLQEKVLLAEFPDCTFLPLEGYGVVYSSNKKGFLFKIAQQLPRINAVIRRENQWLQEVITKEKIDGVISDNRFGLFAKQVPGVFITHQLQIKTGLGRLADHITRTLNYRHINRFSRVWVSDFEGPKNLAGVLSHPSSMPAVPVSYVGPLSRVRHQFLKTENKLLFIFSGPEPQRSIFEQRVLEQLKDVEQPVVIIRGTPLQQDLPLAGKATVYNHLPAKEMETAMQSAALIVCRSGYSSVMDINALRQKSVLIPTPGQTEQEYLARYLMQKGFALSGDQSSFNLRQLLQQAENFSYEGFINADEALLTTAIDAFLQDCRAVAGQTPAMH